jgi:hypothetical protein
VTVSGSTPEEVGRVIGANSVVVYEMRLVRRDLEDVFFALTSAETTS